jgi:mycoredoxin-dependent peroxiredoxin
MAPEIGSPAPDLALRDEHGQLVRLSDFAGTHNVALVFYPYAFSGTCTGELCELRDNLELFEADNVRVLAVSCDPIFTLRAWSEQQKFDFPLLSDFWPHGEVARTYGVFNETVGAAFRGSFLVDTAGVLRWSVVNRMKEPRPLAGYREALAAL